MMKPASNSCKLPLKAPEKDVEEIQGAIASLTVAKETIAIMTVFFRTEWHFHRKRIT